MKTSREELLAIGEKIVSCEGFGAFSYGALAERAGIRKASLHHHYRTKADFALALIERAIERLEGERATAEFDTRRGATAMRALLRERRERLDASGELDLLLAFALEAGALGGPQKAALARARDLVVARIRAILSAARRDRSIAVPGNIEEEACALLAQIEGAELAARLAGDVAAFDQAMATFEGRMSPH